MVFSFFSYKKIIYTLDIGRKYIKAACFEKVDNKKLIMTQFEMIPTPAGAMDKGVIIDDSALYDALNNLLFKKLKYQLKAKMIIAISGKSVITKKIEVPKTESKVLKEYVNLEVSQYLPFDIEDSHFDYVELPFLSQNSSMQTIFFVATHKKTVQAYNACMQKLSVSIDVIDTDFFSMQRILTQSLPDLNLSQNFLILNVGNQVTGFTVVRQGHVIFSRHLVIGVQEYISEAQRRMAIDIKEAQDLIESSCADGQIPDEMMAVIQNYHAQFYRDISMGIEFFHNYFPEDEISKCFITGGGMRLPGLMEDLSKRMEIEVLELPGFACVQTKGFSKKKLKEIQPFSANCIGMALGLIKK